MKQKAVAFILTVIFSLVLCGYTNVQNTFEDTLDFDIEDFYDYQKQYKTEEIEVCSKEGAKTYMDYRMTTVVDSKQYQFIHNELTVDLITGFLYDKDGFLAVALGSYYGEIGDRFYFTLDTGVVLPLVKAEEKADIDTDTTGCYHKLDTSVIEFVIDSDCAAKYFWDYDNGLVLNGNYNNYSEFSGDIKRVEKVLDEKNDKIVTYFIQTEIPGVNDIFNYASGY